MTTSVPLPIIERRMCCTDAIPRHRAYLRCVTPTGDTASSPTYFSRWTGTGPMCPICTAPQHPKCRMLLLHHTLDFGSTTYLRHCEGASIRYLQLTYSMEDSLLIHWFAIHQSFLWYRTRERSLQLYVLKYFHLSFNYFHISNHNNMMCLVFRVGVEPTLKWF